MSPEILGPRVHDEIRPVLERVLQPRRPKRGIDNQERSPRMRPFRIIREIVGLPRRIEGRLDMDHIARSEVRSGAVERDLGHPRQTVVNGENTVGPVISTSDRYFLGLEVGL